MSQWCLYQNATQIITTKLSKWHGTHISCTCINMPDFVLQLCMQIFTQLKNNKLSTMCTHMPTMANQHQIQPFPSLPKKQRSYKNTIKKSQTQKTMKRSGSPNHNAGMTTAMGENTNKTNIETMTNSLLAFHSLGTMIISEQNQDCHVCSLFRIWTRFGRVHILNTNKVTCTADLFIFYIQ